MDPKPVYYNPDEYQEIREGVIKVHRRTILRGLNNIQIQGQLIIKESSIIRGDLAQITIGKFVLIYENVILKPSYKKDDNGIKFINIKIGDYVSIQKDTIIEASKIGSNVQIGKNCIISHRCVIGDCCVINDDSIVPPDTVIPPYSEYGGRPAIYLSELPEASLEILKERAKICYKTFIPLKK